MNFVSLYDAMRYANWFNNGGVGSDTEMGAYTLLGGTPIPSNGTTVTRNPPNATPHAADGLIVFRPSEDEWYKAAYYDGATASYFDYPTRSDVETVCSAPTATPNRANCDLQPDVTNVGTYTGSASPYGTLRALALPSAVGRGSTARGPIPIVGALSPSGPNPPGLRGIPWRSSSCAARSA